jgi:aspartate/methionine/tyrosine aminotransferase
MRWAKALAMKQGIHNLADSSVRDLLSKDDLGLDRFDLPVWGGHVDGLPALREAIGVRYRIDPARVLTSEGSSLANFLILAAWVRPGDPVLIEDPFYEPLGAVLESLDARIRPVAVDGSDGHRAILDVLKEGNASRWRAVVITNPHNPSGRRLDDTLLSELADACQTQGAILLVDEVYRDLLFEDRCACAAHHGPAVVSTSSLTKAYGLGSLRMGWAIGRQDLINHAIRIHDNLGVDHPTLMEAIGAHLIGNTEQMDSWRERIRHRMKTNRKLLATFLADRPGFEDGSSDVGIIAFPRWRPAPGQPEADELCRLVRERARVALVPGQFFRRPNRVRFGIGGPEKEVEEGLQALGGFLDSLGKA